MTMFGPEDIAHNSTLTLDDPPLWLFGVLQSGMFTAWAQNICGRLKSDIRVEPDIGYNAFPFIPELPQQADRIEPAAQGVLDARAAFPSSSLAALYDPLATPPPLSRAHDALDAAVDAVFAPRRRLRGEVERLAVLLKHYQRLTSPLLASSRRVRKRA